MNEDAARLHAMCHDCALVRELPTVDVGGRDRTCCYCGRTTRRIVSTFVDDPEYLTCDHAGASAP